MQKITGIILAGGKSRRMGRDKCFLKLNSNKKTMIEHVIELFIAQGLEIIISANDTKKYKIFGFPVINDLFSDRGPLAGIYSALSFSNTLLNVIAPCDMPFLNWQLYELLLKNLSDKQAIIPILNNQPYPLNAIINKNTTHIIYNQLIHNRLKVLCFYKKIDAMFLEIPLYFKKALINLNNLKDVGNL